ncbi:MAG: sugar transferase [Pseudochelatococcus sp.]|jgi:lipopolysaccharide/colanic/teichoic acid biosynthesis glycosyltransferase|uniref:sugar transferase n=1 Tax=Pseudochelatococcus sp. TaxID=2020869 RepID=UPI003D8C0190
MYNQIGYLGGLGRPQALSQLQLPGGLLFAIGIPFLVRIMVAPEVFFSINHQVTVSAGIIAHLAGYFIYRRLGTFPGVAAAGVILPTFLLTYGIVFVAIFLFRWDYSRFQAMGSFLMSVTWYFGLNLLRASRSNAYRLAIIPGGNVGQLRRIKGVSWHMLPSPEAAIGHVHGVVADLRTEFTDAWERFITNCALSGTPVYHVKQITESLTGRVEIEHLSENMLGSLTPNTTYTLFKFILDWIVALIVAIVLLPFFLLVAVAIRLDSPGPALFRQKRVGHRGEVFTVYKFRTMRPVEQTKDGGSAREQAMTRDGDKRITKLGHFLRKSRIDELPQIINILRGEMSWIGPRPEAEVLSRWYEKELPFYLYRHIVRPGITGWAQINQGHVTAVEDVHEKLHYDFYYIKHFSPWLDIMITLGTIKTMLTGFGAR